MNHSLRWEKAIVYGCLISLLFHYAFLWLITPFSINVNIFGLPQYILLPQNIPFLVIFVMGGIPLIWEIVKNMTKGNFGVDLLASIAIVTAVYMGEYVAACLLILMLSGGEVLEVYAMKKASSVLALLAERMPYHAHVKIDNKILDIPISDLKINDTIVVYPHEVCPVDGLVLEGHGFMDESYLTGEPYKISKGPGTKVLSGSINGETLLLIKAEKLSKDSRYAKIMKIMEDSEQQRPQMRRLADQLGTIFTPISLLVAFFVWHFSGDPTRFLAVLVIATPCPLLIAIPISIISAISLSARRGIIIKDPIILEQLPLCRTAIFDKTGTLTYGYAELVDIDIPSSQSLDRDAILQLVASIECYSKHPLAIAILKAAHKSGLVIMEADHISEIPGMGLTGKVRDKVIHLTNRKHIESHYQSLVSQLPVTQPGLECIVLVNGAIGATFRFRDTLRDEGDDFIRHLAPVHAFNKVMIVSGDRPSEVNYLAKKLGIQEAYSSKSPEEKIAIVTEEVKQAKTLYVGDGINDAPALAAATVGIAFGSSSILSEVGGAVILESSLIKVDELFHISALMRKIALQSAAGGMILSFIGMGFAAAGFISPVMGALLQEGIDLLAIFNALRLTWVKNLTKISDIDKS